MHRFTAFLLLGGIVACGNAPELDPVRPHRARIVNGSTSPINLTLTAGQMAAVIYLADSSGSEFCSGTVIHPRIVATAQHCVSGRTAMGTFVGFGAPSSPDALIPVAEIHEHPSIDFAALVLGRDATVEVPGLDPIDMNRTAVDATWVGRWLDASGYGATCAPGDWGCNEVRGRFWASVQVFNYDSETVSVDGHGIQGICYGDSGGPILWQATSGSRPVLVGTEQWGDSSCVDQDHLSRVDVVASFVDDILANPLPPELLPCGSIDYLGECQNGDAVWCGAGYLRVNECAASGLQCGWMGPTRGNDCLPSVCGSIDYLGECNGDVLTYCRAGAGLVTRDCTTEHLACLWENATVGNNCGGCTRCDGVCVEFATSLEHCGGCDQPCAPPHAEPSCQGGVCRVGSCQTGYLDMDGLPGSGCEYVVPPPADPDPKGGCDCRQSSPGVWAALLMPVFALRRRRRRP